MLDCAYILLSLKVIGLNYNCSMLVLMLVAICTNAVSECALANSCALAVFCVRESLYVNHCGIAVAQLLICGLGWVVHACGTTSLARLLRVCNCAPGSLSLL